MEFCDRLLYIEETLLGALCRSLIKLPVFGKLGREDEILNKIAGRVKEIKDLYALESVCMFCSLIDSERSKEVLS